MSDISFELPPPDCDLRDYPFMLLDVVRLRDSAIVDAVTGDEFRAAVLLWCASWHQVPAGSLPDDDAQLAKYAGYGRVVKEWQRVRAGALYGFEKGSDGRLYHPVIVEKAIEAWAGRRSASRRGKAGASKRWGNRSGSAIENGDKGDALAILKNSSATPIDSSAIAPATEKHSKGKGQGQGDVPLAKANGREGADLLSQVPDAKPVKPADPWQEVYAYGKQLLGPSAGGIITNLRKTFNDKPRKVLAKLQDAAETREPAKWINAFLWQHGPPGLEGIDTNGGFV